MLPDTKKCSTCQEVRPIDSFGRKARAKGGISNRCKECDRASGAKYREKNKDRIAEKNRLYREKNKDMVLERERLYREKNREYTNKRILEIKHSRQESSKAMGTQSGAYSTSEDQFIILNHKTMTDYQLAIALGRTYSSTVSRKYSLRKKGLL